MRSLSFLILALALSVSSFAHLAASKIEVPTFTQVKTERVVIGSLADISARYENTNPITVIHILEFSTDVAPREPDLLQVRLCGDQTGRLDHAVHTNITVIYELASQSRLTGCLNLISSEPWQDSSTWQTVTFNSTHVTRSLRHGAFIQSIINGVFPK